MYLRLIMFTFVYTKLPKLATKFVTALNDTPRSKPNKFYGSKFYFHFGIILYHFVYYRNCLASFNIALAYYFYFWPRIISKKKLKLTPLAKKLPVISSQLKLFYKSITVNCYNFLLIFLFFEKKYFEKIHRQYVPPTSAIWYETKRRTIC